MQANEGISVVIPVFNEAPVIERVISELMIEVVDRLPGSEVIVVDDCSNDETPLLLELMAARHEPVRILRSATNRGHGPSVAAGLDAASRPWVFVMDSDAQFEVRDFWKLWDRRHRADVVQGRRDQRADPRHRLVLSTWVQMIVSRLAKQPVPDPNVPFKLFRRELWLDLRDLVGPDPNAPSIMISLGAALRGQEIESIPVAHLPRPHGPSKLRAGRLLSLCVAALWESIAYRRRVLRSTPPHRRGEEAEIRSTSTT